MTLSKTKKFIAAGLFSGIIVFSGGNLISSAQAVNLAQDKSNQPLRYTQDKNNKIEFNLTKTKINKKHNKIIKKHNRINNKRLKNA